jgi:CCR4-NOT transcription complex subunit 7/8
MAYSSFSTQVATSSKHTPYDIPLSWLKRSLWIYNFHTKIRDISKLFEAYPYVAEDTEFPGFVLKTVGEAVDLQYQTITFNLDLLKIIQTGITLADENGNHPPGVCNWQFNFKLFLPIFYSK